MLGFPRLKFIMLGFWSHHYFYFKNIVLIYKLSVPIGIICAVLTFIVTNVIQLETLALSQDSRGKCI